ncbi:hypothetical protein [Pseudomonas fulva]|uniref:hypothetical protein n=1 Tax=Pseudomonas fulva TaxID=47880 RepID=UPI0038105A2F
MRYSSALDGLKAHWDFKLPVDAKAIAQKMGIEVRPAEPGSRESGHYVFRDRAPLIIYNPSETTVLNASPLHMKSAITLMAILTRQGIPTVK